MPQAQRVSLARASIIHRYAVLPTAGLCGHQQTLRNTGARSIWCAGCNDASPAMASLSPLPNCGGHYNCKLMGGLIDTLCLAKGNLGTWWSVRHHLRHNACAGAARNRKHGDGRIKGKQ